MIRNLFPWSNGTCVGSVELGLGNDGVVGAPIEVDVNGVGFDGDVAAGLDELAVELLGLRFFAASESLE